MTTTFSPQLQPKADERESHVSLRIVVADDNIDAATSLAKLLQLAGYDVVGVAYDGPSALDAIFRRRASVGLLDIALPGMDGYTIARAVRERLGSSPRLVAVTGLSRSCDRTDAMEAGFNAHLTKPVSWHDLDTLLRSYEAELGGRQNSPTPSDSRPVRPR